MKLGALPVNIHQGSKLNSIYNTTQVIERHRSKYSFDRRYSKDLAAQGLNINASSASDGQTEGFEWKEHPWGIGVQYHPEFVSRPSKPHPLFVSFIRAALDNKS